MTEAEAWREIARRIVEGEWVQCGLCRETWYLRIKGDVAISVWWRMHDHLKYHLNAFGLDWAYPAGTEPEARALAALWLALEAEEDDA
jgi:hypothetical protein